MPTIKVETATISGLIQALQKVLKTLGDGPIVMSSDEEGNSFGTINVKDFIGKDEKFAIMYPWEKIYPYE